jgi:RNA polymerase-binding transcription factor DksA
LYIYYNNLSNNFWIAKEIENLKEEYVSAIVGIEVYRERLIQELKVIQAWLDEHSDCFDNEGFEHGHVEQAKEEYMRQCSRKKERKVDIEAAIKRIDAGTFGICIEERCGKAIDRSRLEGDLVRKRCAECQLNYVLLKPKNSKK